MHVYVYMCVLYMYSTWRDRYNQSFIYLFIMLLSEPYDHVFISAVTVAL